MGYPEDCLSLQLATGDNRYLSINITSTATSYLPDGITTAEEATLRKVVLQDIVGVYGRESVTYRLDGNGIVRRWNGGDRYGKLRQERIAGVEERSYINGPVSPQEGVRLSLNALERIYEEIPNSRLERQMGYQLQPVGVEEIDKLTDMLSQQDVVAKIF